MWGGEVRVCGLTWHDPLADQFLSGSSLLKFKLEGCMDTEGAGWRRRRRRRGRRRRRQRNSG